MSTVVDLSSVSTKDNSAPVLVIGGGVSGQRAAADLLKANVNVILIEKADSLGGTMAQLGMMFPQHNCLLCRGDLAHGNGCTRPTLSNDLLDHTKPDSLVILTRHVLENLERHGAVFKATLRGEPRYVIPEKCILCDRCANVCPKELPDPYQAGLSLRKALRKAAYRPSERSVPDAYAISKGDWCEGCGKCAEICPTKAINLNETASVKVVEASAVVIASGMNLYDAEESGEYGFGRFSNVVSGLQLERMTSPAGPGEGRIARPSDGQKPTRIAWLQCVGSRDEKHDYCSSFCCAYATKQAVLTKRLIPGAEARIFMMDDRVFGREFSRTYDPLRRDYGIHLERSRVSVLREDPATKDIIFQVQSDDGRTREERFNLVVLSTGATAAHSGLTYSETGFAETKITKAKEIKLSPDRYGFLRTNTLTPVDSEQEGIFIAGNIAGPADIADSAAQGSAAAASVCAFLAKKKIFFPKLSIPITNKKPDGLDTKGRMPRIGVFTCHCAGEIGDLIDLEDALAAVSSRCASSVPLIAQLSTARVVPFGCQPEGIEYLCTAIETEKLDAVVIGACKRRTYGPFFEKALPVPVRFVSLREECSYVHQENGDGANEKARELLFVALQRLAADFSLETAPTVVLPPLPRVLVQGGGLAGLTASLHLASLGLKVDLVERSASLGGNALRLNKSPEGEDIPFLVNSLTEKVSNNPLIDVHTGTTVVKQKALGGRFEVSMGTEDGEVSQDGGVSTFEVGAVVMATGGREYRGPVYGLGASNRVITLLDLGEKMRADKALPEKLKQIVFIGCVGPWDEPGNGDTWRCSRTCCETMIRQARSIKESNPECLTAVAVREVNTYGFREEEYTAARKAGVLFIRFDPLKPPQFSEVDGNAELLVPDMNLGQSIEFSPDIVVLSAAILPRKDALHVSAASSIPLSGDGFFKEWESKTGSYATLEPGVFVCGLAHGPKPVREVLIQSLAAAQNAAIFALKDKIVQPHKCAKVNEGACAGCLTCIRSCPYLVPRIGKQGKAVIDIFRCQGCGTCVSECPAAAISLEAFNPKPPMVGDNTGGVSQKTQKPRITVISCMYCGNVPVELAGIARNQYPASVRVIEVPCTGLVTAEFIMKTLEQGAEGLVVLACPEGSCHHLTGNTRAKKRFDYASSFALEAGVNPKRIRFLNLGVGMGEIFADLMKEMAKELEPVV